MTAKTAWEGRIDQRRADAYLQVLTIVEREGHWTEAWVANLTSGAFHLLDQFAPSVRAFASAVDRNTSTGGPPALDRLGQVVSSGG